MYGMVNQAIEAMVTEKFGAEQWERVKARAGVDEPTFVAMKQYPDSVTYALAGAVAEVLELPLPGVLRAFGVYWIEYARRGPWGKIMMAAGHGTYELLAALDQMHARIAVSFPELRPPSFRVEPRDGGVLLEYRSERPGLSPFVIGLVEGIGTLYDERVEVEQVTSREAGAPFDSFLVRAAPAKGG
jgi:hypothetical protein